MTTEILFQKRTVAELSENEMVLVDGGTSTPCIGAGAAAAAGAVAVGYTLIQVAEAGFAFGSWLAQQIK
jgi:predicted flavoprotein YhiN